MSAIMDFLNKNATSAIIQRAKEIISRQLIEGFRFHENERKITAYVFGNRKYTVEIILAGKNNFFSMCNCPYNYQGVCKHIAAVMLRFDQGYGDIIVQEKKKTLLITDHEQLNIPELVKYHKTDEYTVSLAHELALRVSLKKYKGENTIKFNVLKYSGYYYSEDSERVTFSKTKSGIEAGCSCESANPCCSHTIATLIFIKEIAPEQKYLSFLDASFRKESKIAFAKNYGITNNGDISKHLKIGVHKNDIIFRFTGKLLNLSPVGGKSLEVLDNYRKIFIQQYLSPDKFLPEVISEQNTPKYGFGVLFSLDYDIEELSGIDCFIAKYNKKGDKLLSGFEITRLEDHPELDEHEHSVLELVSRLQTKIDFSGNNQHEVYQLYPLLKNLFELLNENIFCYTRYWSDWYSRDQHKIRKSDLTPISIATSPYSLEYDLCDDDEFMVLKSFLTFDQERISFSEVVSKDVLKGDLLAIYKDQLYLVNSFSVVAALSEMASDPIKKTFHEYKEVFIHNYVIPLTEDFKINNLSKSVKEKSVTPKKFEKKLYISDMGQFVLFRPFMNYGEELEINILKGGSKTFYASETITVVERNKEEEAVFLELIKNLHLKFGRQYPDEFFYLKIDDMMKDHWFFDAFDNLSSHGVSVLGLNDLKNFKYHPSKARISTSISSGEDWFDAKIEVVFGDIHISLKDVRKAILKQERYITLSDGSLGILPQEWLDRFSKLFRHGEINGDRISISSRKFLIIDELFEQIDDLEVAKILAEKKKKLDAFSSIKNTAIPKTIKADLRPYQKEGLNWLNFLHQFNWGGILADDMGLGKTLQILAFIAKLKSKIPSLIVVPTTLIFNWDNEVKKFCPSLKVYFHYGPARSKDGKEFKGNDIVITTYGVVSNDIAWLSKSKFNYVILDESQAIKNPQSLRFKSVCLLKGRNKLALTGTPIENNTFDLYAQMQFANPGIFSSAKSFKDNYSVPIDKEGSQLRAAELRKLIKPFMIRRTKEQVAKELPPKTEDVIYCTMEAEQRKVYDAYRNKYRDKLLGKIEEDGLQKSKIYVIEGLMKLRQICDSPQLLSDEENYGASSIKIDELLRNIENKTGNHKIVVFSQFVSMLSIIREKLDEDKVSYEYLDGKSSQLARQKSVEYFQTDESCRVFLISLKAGGTGLNLTAADYVFLVDPWWNPAVEEQAIDRCYRIGQDKKVFAYRMICKDTIEEKIINYQQRKKAVAADIIQAEESFVKNLSKDDIDGLFS